MCGRYTLAIEYQELAEELGVDFDPVIAEVYRARYNIAPTDGMLVLREKEGGRELVPARFGLVNFWAKDLSGAARQINARSETVRDKPAFRDAFERRRCVVPADGFYEWKREGRARTPFWFHPSEGGLLRFAGLYETWKDKATGHALRTFAILTTAANDVVGEIHDRMPVVLDKEHVGLWLSGSGEEAYSLLRTADNGVLSVQRASRRVGNVRNDDPGLLRESGEEEEEEMPLFRGVR
ncbi:MAG: SOS response-associated peptidase [Polyangiaceae bacterium]